MRSRCYYVSSYKPLELETIKEQDESTFQQAKNVFAFLGDRLLECSSAYLYAVEPSSELIVTLNEGIYSVETAKVLRELTSWNTENRRRAAILILAMAHGAYSVLLSKGETRCYEYLSTLKGLLKKIEDDYYYQRCYYLCEHMGASLDVYSTLGEFTIPMDSLRKAHLCAISMTRPDSPVSIIPIWNTSEISSVRSLKLLMIHVLQGVDYLETREQLPGLSIRHLCDKAKIVKNECNRVLLHLLQEPI